MQAFLKSVDVANAWNPSRQIRMPTRLVRRLETEDFVQSIGLDGVKVQHLSDDLHIMTLRGRATLLDKAEETINLIRLQLSSEAKRVLTVPTELLGRILGTNRSRWHDMVERCGGPERRDLQDLMIEMCVLATFR
jgi:hypothetical protein